MKRNIYTKQLLEPLIESSKSWAEVCRKIGIKPFTGAQTHLKKRALEFKISHSHFSGQAWNKGKTFIFKNIKYYLKKNTNVSSHALKKRLFKCNLKKRKCEFCGIVKWKGLDAPLELDHINNDHWDNRLKNLQILCSNCHSLKKLRVSRRIGKST